jgi:hypothetical protein
MRSTVVKTVLSFVFIFFFHSSFAQGCSDAGFCTVSSFKPHGNDSVAKTKNRIKLGMNYGSADNSIGE